MMWECECGHIDYGEVPPQDCQKCLRIDSFSKVPEDQISEKGEEKILSEQIEE